MNKYISIGHFDIAGRGLVILVNIPSDEPLPKKGELIEVDGKVWEVRGCECSNLLLYPERRDERVGVLVKEAEKETWPEIPDSGKINQEIGLTGESGHHTYLNHFNIALEAALEELEIYYNEHPDWGIDGIAKNALGMAKHGYRVVDAAIKQLKRDYPEMTDREILDEIKTNIKNTKIYREAQLVPMETKIKSYQSKSQQNPLGKTTYLVEIPFEDPLPEENEVIKIDGKKYVVKGTCYLGKTLAVPSRVRTFPPEVELWVEELRVTPPMVIKKAGRK